MVCSNLDGFPFFAIPRAEGELTSFTLDLEFSEFFNKFVAFANEFGICVTRFVWGEYDRPLE